MSFEKLLGIEFIKFADEGNLKKVQACLDLEVDVNATGPPGETTMSSGSWLPLARRWVRIL